MTHPTVEQTVCARCEHTKGAHGPKTNYWCRCGCPEYLTPSQYMHAEVVRQENE